MHEFAGWVARWFHQAEGGRRQAARLRVRSLPMCVQMAAELLTACNERRRSAQYDDATSPVPEPQFDWRARVQRDACSEHSQLRSLAMWVRLCGHRGKRVAAECLDMVARRVRATSAAVLLQLPRRQGGWSREVCCAETVALGDTRCSGLGLCV